ncbi:hypothetical protein [Pedobacter boryungensis]|uniref:Uncharacterized protein n=1 Tax=Pedobacter boryungensis TaxID=869962 RepID=A0ABX2DC91_9SPHI|nr:hypothetical protein [Pedobacter boryungensis]NQX31647.1 hypothetical protein [Pedobacter boryungensis]
MAKARSVIKLSGTIGDITFVDSQAYGFHGRKKRTVWEKSDGMVASSTNQAQANLMAKIIFDAVNEFAPGFKNGKFWSRLVSVFRQQKKANEVYNYAGFDGMEMRLDYPISKKGRFTLNHKNENAKHTLTLNYYLNIISSYKLSILRIATDETLLVPIAIEKLEGETKEGEKNGSLDFQFPPLPENAQVLYVLQCEQLKNGKTTGLMNGKSVVFLKAN